MNIILDCQFKQTFAQKSSAQYSNKGKIID